jgi:hypothetical protein
MFGMCLNVNIDPVCFHKTVKSLRTRASRPARDRNNNTANSRSISALFGFVYRRQISNFVSMRYWPSPKLQYGGPFITKLSCKRSHISTGRLLTEANFPKTTTDLANSRMHWPAFAASPTHMLVHLRIDVLCACFRRHCFIHGKSSVRAITSIDRMPQLLITFCRLGQRHAIIDLVADAPFSSIYGLNSQSVSIKVLVSHRCDSTRPR